MGGGEVYCAVGLFLNHGVGDGWRWSWIRNHQGRDAVGDQNFAGHGAESLAQETRIASDNDASACGLLRNHVPRDTGHRPAHVGESELVSHDCAPAGSSEMNLGRHFHSPLLGIRC